MPTPEKILLVHPLGYRADAAGKDITRLANIVADHDIRLDNLEGRA